MKARSLISALPQQMIARHVIGVHLNAAQPAAEGELDVKFLKKYVQYCRDNCGPRLSPAAMEKLKNHFVQVG
jgi:DNA replication licensing factor MCM5